MLIKLVKHELKATWKTLVISIGISVLFMMLSILSTSNSLSLNQDSFIDLVLPLFSVVVLLFGGIMTLMYIINSFRKTIFGREGYLTLTLPVTTHELIISRFLVVLVWVLLVAVVFIISVFSLLTISLLNYGYSFSEVFESIGEVIIELVTDRQFLRLISIYIVEIIKSIFLIWLSISMAHTRFIRSRRTLIAFVIYVSLSYLLIIAIPSSSYIGVYFDLFAFEKDSFMLYYLINAVLVVGMYFGIYYILEKAVEIE